MSLDAVDKETFLTVVNVTEVFSRHFAAIANSYLPLFCLSQYKPHRGATECLDSIAV